MKTSTGDSFFYFPNRDPISSQWQEKFEDNLIEEIKKTILYGEIN